MGDQVSCHRLLSLVLVFAPTAAAAQIEDAAARIKPAAGVDVFYAGDADDTQLVRMGLNLDGRHRGSEDYLGIRVEKAWFNPSGQGWQSDERVYLRAANGLGEWKYAAQLGTDGDTLLGAVSIHDETKFRKEFFVEREIIETPKGLSQGIYYTFAGAAIDLPADERNILTLVGGVQTFTGDNVRKHLRVNYVHVLEPESGLSLQLRTRYFRNSHPREYDYYSPRYYMQALPVLQVRHFSKGWMYLVAGGIGAQRDNFSGWRRSSFYNTRVTRPLRSGWALTGGILFSETPTTGQSYNYRQVDFGVTRAF